MLVEAEDRKLLISLLLLNLISLQHLRKEPMPRNSDKYQRMRISFKNILASLVGELERRSTQLSDCLEQWETSSPEAETDALMRCCEQYEELRLLLVRCSRLSKLLARKPLLDLLGVNNGDALLETLQEQLARLDLDY